MRPVPAVRMTGRPLAGLLVLLAACGREIGPTDLTARFAIHPVFRLADGAAGAGIVEIAATRVMLERMDETPAFDSVFAVPEGADSLEITVTVTIQGATERFVMTLEFRTPTGEVAFHAGPVEVTGLAGAGGGSAPVPVDVEPVYVGVGAGAVSVRIAQTDLNILFGTSATLTAEALDGQGSPVPGTPIAWRSLDPGVADVPSPAVGTVVAGSAAGSARIVAQLLTGPADTLTANVVASIGATLIFHASGISDFSDPDSAESGRWFEIVDPTAMTVFPPLATSRGTDETVGLAYDPARNRVFATDRDCTIYSVDPLTGAESLLGIVCYNQGTQYFKGLAFEPGTGRLLAGSTPEFGDGMLYEIDPVTGASAPIGQVLTAVGDTVDGYNGFAFSPGGGAMFIVGHRRGESLSNRYLMTLDVATLTATVVALLPETGVSDITFTGDGILYAVTGDGATTPETLWTVNPGTAAMTSIMALGHGDDGEAIVAIPAAIAGLRATSPPRGRH